MKRPTPRHTQLAKTIEDTVLLLTCALPFLVPFGLTRNIYLQSFVVILLGLIAWPAVWLRWRSGELKLSKALLWLLGAYLLFVVLSLVAHPTHLNLVGAPLMLLGTPVLLAVVGCGLALRNIETKRLVRWLYVSFVMLALISVPYALWTSHHIGRLGSVFHQPDFLAVCMGLGLLLGIAMWQQHKSYRIIITASQLSLAATLFLTQTRAVIFIAIVLYLFTVFFVGTAKRQKVVNALMGIVLLGTALLGLKLLAPARLTNVAEASQSTNYRLSLQHFSLQAAWHEPLLGFGAGSVLKAIPCPSLHNASLQDTCHSGYYFDSSHNVYLDRVLELGWLGGLSFMALTGLCLWKGFRGDKSERLFAYCLLLVALYYFTNPSDIEIELLFWIFALRPYATMKLREKVPS